MTEKTYKVRVEISFIVNFDVQAAYDDDAENAAVECALMNAEKMADDIRSYGRVRVPNYDARVIEMEEI